MTSAPLLPTSSAMAHSAFPDPDEWTAVRWALQDCGYADLVASLNPLTTELCSVANVYAVGDPRVTVLLDLLMLDRPVRLDAVPNALREVLPVLQAAGVMVRAGDRVQMSGLALYRHQGSWLIAQAQQASPTMYVGDDSFALAQRLETRAGGAALDLCAGPGIQALVAAARGMRVVAVEINPVAASLAMVNRALNGVAEQVEVRIGDLWGCVGAIERFDLVAANPPLLPIPEGVAYPFVGDGGPDGLDVTRRILDPVAEHLTPSGTAQVLGITLSDGFFPHCLPWLRTWCAEQCLDALWATSHHLPTTPDSWWCMGVAMTACSHESVPGSTDDAVAELAAALSQGYRDLRAPAVCDYFLRVRPGRGEVTYLDLSDPGGSPGLWYR